MITGLGFAQGAAESKETDLVSALHSPMASWARLASMPTTKRVV